MRTGVRQPVRPTSSPSGQSRRWFAALLSVCWTNAASSFSASRCARAPGSRFGADVLQLGPVPARVSLRLHGPPRQLPLDGRGVELHDRSGHLRAVPGVLGTAMAADAHGIHPVGGEAQGPEEARGQHLAEDLGVAGAVLDLHLVARARLAHELGRVAAELLVLVLAGHPLRWTQTLRFASGPALRSREGMSVGDQTLARPMASCRSCGVSASPGGRLLTWAHPQSAGPQEDRASTWRSRVPSGLGEPWLVLAREQDAAHDRDAHPRPQRDVHLFLVLRPRCGWVRGSPCRSSWCS